MEPAPLDNEGLPPGVGSAPAGVGAYGSAPDWAAVQEDITSEVAAGVDVAPGIPRSEWDEQQAQALKDIRKKQADDLHEKLGLGKKKVVGPDPLNPAFEAAAPSPGTYDPTAPPPSSLVHRDKPFSPATGDTAWGGVDSPQGFKEERRFKDDDGVARSRALDYAWNTEIKRNNSVEPWHNDWKSVDDIIAEANYMYNSYANGNEIGFESLAWRKLEALRLWIDQEGEPFAGAKGALDYLGEWLTVQPTDRWPRPKSNAIEAPHSASTDPHYVHPDEPWVDYFGKGG